VVPNLSNICVIRIDLASNIYRYISKISMRRQALLSGNLFYKKTKLSAMIKMIHITTENIFQLIFLIINTKSGSIYR
jgi:hypothetical protein